MIAFETYDHNVMQKIYRRHHAHYGSVLYSDDNGITWKVAGSDPGKWHIYEWLFAFMEVEPKPIRKISDLERSKGRSEDYYGLPLDEQWAQDDRLGILDWDGE